MNNYVVESYSGKDKCYECGADATILLVATEPEGETGYVDEVPLCEECAQKHEV